MKERLRVIQLHHTRPFRIARAESASTSTTSVILELLQGDLVGMGESSPSKYYDETVESVTAVLPRMVEGIPDDFDPVEVSAQLARDFPTDRSARAAVDMALYDLAGKHAGKPVCELLGLDAEDTPVTSFTIGIDTPTVMREVAGQVSGRFKVLKIKVGLADDVETIRAIREVTDLPLRVDANCGWNTPREALERLEALAPFNIQFCEQPLPAGNLSALKEVHERSAIPIMADEDVIGPEDVEGLAGCVSAVNVKLAKCGGIAQAVDTIRRARKLDMRVMVGCMVESSLGITAAAHVTPMVDYADLDGNLLVRDDPYTGVQVRDGKLVLPEGPGLGVETRPV